MQNLLKSWESENPQWFRSVSFKKQSYAKVWELFFDALCLVCMVFFWEGGGRSDLFCEALSYLFTPEYVPNRNENICTRSCAQRVTAAWSQLPPTWKWLSIHQQWRVYRWYITAQNIPQQEGKMGELRWVPPWVPPQHDGAGKHDAKWKQPFADFAEGPKVRDLSIPDEANAQRQKAS